MIRRVLDSPWFYFALAVLLVLVGLRSMIEVRSPDRPKGTLEDLVKLRERKDLNVVFVLIDTLRADRLSSYGYARETSPVMDALAQHGVRFARVTSQSTWTKCSMASLWTGMYPVTHQVLRHQHGLPPEATLPAEIFRDAGYRTSGIWRNGWVAPNFGFDQGFQVYNRPVEARTAEHLAGRTVSASKIGGSDEDITGAAVEFLRGAQRDRFFLYLHYMDVHQYVYDDSANFGPTFSDLYDNAIHWVDRNVGALVASLQQLDLMRRTVIVIASDHGEGFKEHGLEGHARTLYTEVVDVPAIIALPFYLDPGVVVQERVESVDLLPTLLDLVGLPPLPGAQGVSLVPAIQQAATTPPPAEPGNWNGRTSFAELDRTWADPNAEPNPMVAVTDGPWRLIAYARFPERVELFDHRSDPREQTDVHEAHPEITATLRSKMDEYLATPGASWGRPMEVQLDRLRLEQLRALGYDVGEDAAERVPPGGERDLKKLFGPKAKP
jgi:arylsulfatase A-like enzyme